MTEQNDPSASGAGGWFFEPLLPLHFEMICADPPWDHETYSAKGWEKSQMAHYETMTDEEIFALPIGQLASMDAMLLLWSTAPRLDVAIRAVSKWGFTYRSVLVWRKLTRNGKTAMGPGHRVRTTGEIVLVATLGNPAQKWKPRTIFDGVRREHSRKPEEFYDMAERMMPQARRLDLFSRQSRPGWTTWGNEAGKFDVPAIGGKKHDGRRSDQRSLPRERCLFGDLEEGS